MNGYAPVASYDKPLPQPGGHQHPQKMYNEQGPGAARNGAHHHLDPINTSGLNPNAAAPNSAMLTPMSSAGYDSALPSPSGDDKGKKKSNPLTDLVETEKVYVDLLTGIIRKVAAAWSRSNLPPPELDSMFRSIESVYKANRSLLSKLKEIGANPSSPKALGDLLMRWIDDLEPPYTKYSTKYVAGFDIWDPVQSNPRLATTLAMFSSSNPPPLPTAAPQHPAEPPMWTLDTLFLLPKDRIRYYRKLYSRLLKSTTPGRSDHRLLTGALEKLDGLVATLDQRSSIRVGAAAQEAEDEVVVDMRLRDSTMPLAPPSNRGSDSTHASSNVSSNFSQDTAATSVSRSSTSTLSMPITDLERRLTTDRTLDIFTMQPKQVRLQISPPSLHYARELRISADVVLSLVPRATGIEYTQQRGHIYILTDLLLMCERMTPQESASYGPDGPDMWLLYPPLAGKHLKVSPTEGNDKALNVTILRKEVVTVYTGSRHMRDKILAEFRECIDAAQLLMPSKGSAPPPPVPKLPASDSMPNSPTNYREQNATSPTSPSSSMSPTGSLPAMQQLNDGMSNMNMSGQQPMNSPARMPSLTNGGPGQHPPRQGPGAPPQDPRYGGPGQGMPPSGPGMAGQGMPPLGRMPPPGQGMPPGPGMPMGPGRAMSPNGYGAEQGIPNLNSFNPNGPPPPQQYNGGPPPQQYGPGPGGVMPPPRGASYNGAPGMPASPNPPGRGPMYGDGPSPPPQGPGSRMQSSYPPSSRPASDGSGGPGLRKSTSSRSLGSQYDNRGPSGPVPPMPAYPDGLQPPSRPFLTRTESSGSLSSYVMPSTQYTIKTAEPTFADPSPPSSPVIETHKEVGPTTTRVTAQGKCKVFLKEQHQKWKSLGSAKLTLYHESPTNVKQLVVEQENKRNMLISTIVLPDGVERVGKTGVAIELSDKGLRTGIVYMLQQRDEKSATNLFDSLLAGSDRFEAN